MEETPQPKAPILEVAWNRYAQYDLAANKKKRVQYTMHKWVATLGILATLFAILSSVYPQSLPAWGRTTVGVVLILLPILASSMAAFVNRFYPGSDWLVLRAGAEQVMKEIYQYRTILQTTDRRRRHWLDNRLREIQHEVFNGLNGELIFDAYNGKLPPPHKDGSERKDGGFSDLKEDEYYALRLCDQRDWHLKRVNSSHRERVRLQIWILLVGGAGTFLAAMGGSFSLWVALATSIATALIGWQEIKNLDMAVRNYSKVVHDLTAVSDRWNQLSDTERTRKEYYRMVKDTETVLWNQNREYLKSMKDAFESARMEEEDIVNQTLDGTAPTPATTSSPASPAPAEGGAG